jgi:hypothetical protein
VGGVRTSAQMRKRYKLVVALNRSFSLSEWKIVVSMKVLSVMVPMDGLWLQPRAWGKGVLSLQRDRLLAGLRQPRSWTFTQTGVGGLAIGLVAQVPSRDGVRGGSAFDQQASDFGVAPLGAFSADRLTRPDAMKAGVRVTTGIGINLLCETGCGSPARNA